MYSNLGDPRWGFWTVLLLLLSVGVGHWHDVVSFGFLNRFGSFQLHSGARDPSFPTSFLEGDVSESSMRRLGAYHTREPDTTAVVLNWSRLHNVLKIVSLLCEPSLEGTIATVLVWNNSPVVLSKSDFPHCSGQRLTVHNSPSNLYFQARFMACARSVTPYCFVQDDDYIVLPEVIIAMRSRLTVDSDPIYVVPSHEMLSTHLKTTRIGTHIHTSLVWLGYGAIFPRLLAVQFLELMTYLNMSEGERKMADNYFSILRNVVPETWYDQGIELGGGQAFTVGAEGNERNRRHFARATELLTSLYKACAGEYPDVPFTKFTDGNCSTPISRSPCRGTPCLLQTSIATLPEVLLGAQPATSAEDMLRQEDELRQKTPESVFLHYNTHSLSHAVDGLSSTYFESFAYGKQGDMISMDILEPAGTGRMEMVLLVDVATVSEILPYTTLALGAGDQMTTVEQSIACTPVSRALAYVGYSLKECSFRVDFGTVDVQLFSLVLQRDIGVKWRIYEIWMRGV